MKFFFLFILIILGGGSSSAQEMPTGVALKEEFIAFMGKTQRYGLRSVGGRSIDSIIAEVSTITMRVVPSLRRYAPPEATNDGAIVTYRATAQWDKLTRTLDFSARHLKSMTPFKRPCMTLHEVLGVVDIQDESFQKSAAVCSFVNFNELKEESTFKPNPVLFPNVIQDIELAKGGGSTGVDSGGDLRLLSYRQLLQNEVMFDLQSGRTSPQQFHQVMDFLSQVSIAFSDWVPQGQYSYTPKKKLLLVPNNPAADDNLQKNSKAAQALLDSIVSGQIHGE